MDQLVGLGFVEHDLRVRTSCLHAVVEPRGIRLELARIERVGRPQAFSCQTTTSSSKVSMIVAVSGFARAWTKTS
jgi:hypothetical protein